MRHRIALTSKKTWTTSETRPDCKSRDIFMRCRAASRDRDLSGSVASSRIGERKEQLGGSRRRRASSTWCLSGERTIPVRALVCARLASPVEQRYHRPERHEEKSLPQAVERLRVPN